MPRRCNNPRHAEVHVRGVLVRDGAGGTGSLSRNRWVGIELGKGHSLSEALAGLHGKVAEGVRTTPAAIDLASRDGRFVECTIMDS